MSKLSTLKKNLNKSGFNTTLSTPDVWASWGNMALNYIATGSFRRGIPNRRVVMLYGPSGAGKSFLIGNAVRSVQELGYKVIYLDTEDAIHPEYLKLIGVDIDDEDRFLPIRLYTLEELSEAVSEIFRVFEPDDKIAIFVDSLGMLETEDHYEEFEKKGELKNDMGLLAKKTKKFLKNVSSKVGNRDCFFIVATHSYQNQQINDGRGAYVVSGGEAQIYIPSITFLLRKLNLRSEEKGKRKQVGIKLKARVEKSRFHQTGLEVELEVPYRTGLDPYDGVLELLEDAEIVTRNGAWYSMELDGEVKKFQKKNAAEYLDPLIDIVEEGYNIEESQSDSEEEENEE